MSQNAPYVKSRRLRLIPWLRLMFLNLSTVFLEHSSAWKADYPLLSEGARSVSWWTWYRWLWLENLEMRLRLNGGRLPAEEFFNGR